MTVMHIRGDRFRQKRAPAQDNAECMPDSVAMTIGLNELGSALALARSRTGIDASPLAAAAGVAPADLLRHEREAYANASYRLLAAVAGAMPGLDVRLTVALERD